MRWQTDRTPFFNEEQRAIKKAFPDVEMLEIAGLIFLRGDFPVHDNNSNEVARYKLEIIFPPDYPNKIPVVKAVDTRIKPIADRHVFRDRTACLCLPHEIPLHLPEINFINFWEKLLKFWLIGQAYYDRDGKWPFNARPHNARGIYDGFSELLGMSDENAVKRFTGLLIRKNAAKGHEMCPCGNGKRLRYCHLQRYREVRELLSKDVLSAYRRCLGMNSH